jgi:hypothetical protein
VGSALYERYRRRGDRDDLQRGVRALESALDLMPVEARERAAIAARAEEAIAELQRSSAP